MGDSIRSRVEADRENTKALRAEQDAAGPKYESEQPRAQIPSFTGREGRPEPNHVPEFSPALDVDRMDTKVMVGGFEDVESRGYKVEGLDSFHLFESILNSDEVHDSSRMFYDSLIQAGLLHAKKQRDYGKVGDPFANVRSTVEFGVPAWVGAMVRLNDKVKRLQALARNGELHNESAIDSFMDIAVYALIARVLYEEQG